MLTIFDIKQDMAVQQYCQDNAIDTIFSFNRKSEQFFLNCIVVATNKFGKSMTILKKTTYIEQPIQVPESVSK